MSLPALPPQAISSLTALSPVDSFLQIFNTNPYFIGLMMLILNLGGRFISLDVSKKQEQFLQHPWIRRLLIFTVLFVATRNIWVAFWMTLVVILFLGYLFNENSSICIFGNNGAKGSKCSDTAAKQKEDLTPEEKEILQRLMAKQQRYQQKGVSEKNSKSEKDPSKQVSHQMLNSENEDDEDEVAITDVYAANLSLLRT